MKIYFLLVVVLLAVNGPSDVLSRSLIGPSNPTFDNEYYGLDNMAWNRPNMFFNNDYQALIRNNDEDDDMSESKRRYRPSTNKRRYRPAELDLSNSGIKRGIFGLWKPAQLIGKVNGRQVSDIKYFK